MWICIALEKKVAKWNLLQDFVHISGQRFETDFRLFEHARSILKALKLNDDEKALNDLVLAVDVSYSHTYIYIMHVCVDTYIYIYYFVFCLSTCLCISGTIQGAGHHNHLEWFSPLGEDHLGCTILGHWVPWVISAPIRTVRTCRCYWLVYVYIYICLNIYILI